MILLLLAMVSLLVGALLAQRFTVMALVPATAIVLVLAFGTGVTHAHTAWSMVLTAGTAVIGMQIGYLVLGSSIRRVLARVLSGRSSHHPLCHGLDVGTVSRSLKRDGVKAESLSRLK
jgi:hypothetical protein